MAAGRSWRRARHFGRRPRGGPAGGDATRPASRQGGLTLVELLVVVLIGAILTMVAVPSYVATTTSYRIMGEVNNLVGALQYARSEAIKQGVTVTICTSNGGSTCSASTTSWAMGYVVLANTANGNVLLRQQPAFTGTDTAADIETGAATSIVFSRDGFAGTSTGWNNFASLTAPVLLAVFPTPANIARGQCVAVTVIGQISVLAKNATDSSGLACT